MAWLKVSLPSLSAAVDFGAAATMDFFVLATWAVVFLAVLDDLRAAIAGLVLRFFAGALGLRAGDFLLAAFFFMDHRYTQGLNGKHIGRPRPLAVMVGREWSVVNIWCSVKGASSELLSRGKTHESIFALREST